VLFEVVQVVEDDTSSAATVSPVREGAELRDRVEALGGRLTIRSERGSGISVSGSLPVSR
jgi:glucose-6-phosphate-specific signal transduction histidine kinase